MKQLRSPIVAMILALATGLAFAGAALAQGTSAAAFPSKPIRMIVTVPPGGAADFIARTVSSRLASALNQPVLVENRAGASGYIAADFVAKSAPDGYTLLQNSITTHGIGPHLYAKLPLEPMKDLVPVTLLAKLPVIMVINANQSFTTLAELISAARQRPGQIAFASSGNGGAPHMSGELFKAVVGVDLLHVPYKGSGPAVTDLVGGQVQVMFDGAPSLLANIQAGKLKAVATASERRTALMPDLPTFNELGYRGIDIAIWYGVMAPAGTPTEITTRLASEFAKVLQMPEVRERFLSQGTEPMGGTPEQAGAFIRAEFERWGAVVRKAGVKAD